MKKKYIFIYYKSQNLIIKSETGLQENWFFFIKRKIGNINYKLNFPKNMCIYSVFYIFLLELVDPEILVQNKSPKLLSENKYKIEKIINYNINENI